MAATTPLDLAEKWRTLAAQQRQLGAEAQACTLEWCADEQEASWREWRDEPLTIAEAVAESGYDRDTLGKHVRNGVIPNAGQPNKPRIRRRHLPRKPGHFSNGPGPRANVVSTKQPRTSNGGRRKYDPEEDARSIAQLLEAKS